MKKISILLISILLIILNLTTIYADEISIEELYNDKSKAMINTNEYEAYKIYDSSTKVIIDDNQVVPDGFILLILKLFISIILLSIIEFFISKIIEKSFEYRY